MSFLRGNLVLYIRNYIISLFILIPWVSFSQGINNIWLSGYDCGNRSDCGVSTIDFSTGFPDTLHTSSPMNFFDCNANISDSLGNLLFYTNGIYIANANHDTMLNGSGLNPSSYTSQHINEGLRVKQGNLILPMPGTQNIYYLFHETMELDASINDNRPFEIYYSIIDMSQDSGRGAITQKNLVLLSDTLTIGSITSCKHANGRDWWIVFHKGRGRRYYEYLLTPSGLQGPFVQDIGYSILPRDWSWQSCFSPDGNKYASVFTKDTFDIMDFDRCTGLFANSISINLNDSAFARGLAFSNNSQMLYVSSSTYVYQYSVNSNPIDSSKFVISSFDRFADPIPPFYSAFYLTQLAINGKIYIATTNSTRWLSVVNTPDSFGLSCNFLEHSFLLPTINAYTIPNFPNYFLGRVNGSICDSLPFVMSNPIHKWQRGRLSILPLRLVSDSRGEDITPLKDDYDERRTYNYFTKKTSESIGR